MPIGGAHLDQKALENVALNTVKSFNGELTALYVVEGSREKGRVQAEKVLANAAWKAEHFEVKIKKIIDYGDPAEIILKHADSHDLIIMGAGKRGLFKKVVMGHIAREMCATSTLPVILVRGRHIR
jgi:nucleotide-binding universal stress UspA family protein